jgi:chemotaxis protein MotB
MSDNNASTIKIVLAVSVIIAAAGWGLFLAEKSERRQVETKLSHTKQSLQKSRAETGRIKSLLEAGRKNNNKLEALLEESRAEKRSLNEQLEAAQQKGEKLEAMLAEDQATKTRLGNELKALANQHQKLESRLNESKEQLKGKSAQLEQTHDQVARLNDEQAFLKSELKKNAAEIARKTETLSSVQAHLTAISDELSRSRANIEKLKGEVSKLKLLRKQEAISFARLRKTLEKQIEADQVKVHELQNRVTVIQVGAKAMFRSGSSVLSASGQHVLDGVIDLLKGIPDRQISVEGHTDNMPLGKKLIATYNSNWELSAHRAAAAVRYLQAHGVDPKRMQVAGYGEHHPVADNGTEEGKAKNRRIEIRLRPAETMLSEKILSPAFGKSVSVSTGLPVQEK